MLLVQEQQFGVPSAPLILFQQWQHGLVLNVQQPFPNSLALLLAMNNASSKSRRGKSLAARLHPGSTVCTVIGKQSRGKHPQASLEQAWCHIL